MTSKNILTIILSISFIWANAQTNLWKAMPNNNEFIDTRCIYQDSTTGILYVGGKQKVVAGDTENCISFWNGNNWDHLGDGAGSHATFVLSIIIYQDTIYAGGAFDAIYGSPATDIMKWNGTSWLPVGNGICEGVSNAGFVGSFNKTNGLLYVTGMFDTIGCLFGNGVATWDGTNWQTAYDFAASGAGGNAAATVEYNGHIYVAGFIAPPDGYSGCCIVYFDGSQWQTVGGGITGTFPGLFDMIVYKNELYVAGRFFVAEGNAGNSIERWDGTQWHDVGGGTDGVLNKLLVYHDRLYAFGGFSKAGGISAQNMACWDGSKWCGMNGNYTFKNEIVTAGIYNDTILVAGGFKICSVEDTIRYFAKWLGGDYVDSCSAPVGISEINQSNFDFSISPNPATNEFIVSTSENGLLTITNELGQVIRSFAVHERQLKSSSSKFPSGNYFLTFQTDTNIQTKKLLIQH